MPPTRRQGPAREQFWRTTVADWRKSCQTAQAFGAARGVSTASLYAWHWSKAHVG